MWQDELVQKINIDQSSSFFDHQKINKISCGFECTGGNNKGYY